MIASDFIEKAHVHNNVLPKRRVRTTNEQTNKFVNFISSINFGNAKGVTTPSASH